jgi:hypothetical protein
MVQILVCAIYENKKGHLPILPLVMCTRDGLTFLSQAPFDLLLSWNTVGAVLPLATEFLREHVHLLN